LKILLTNEGVFETQYLPIEEPKTNKISVSKTPVNSKEPLLYHKTTYRPWYGKTMEKIKNGEVFDEIFFNEKGELTEGSRTNIILQLDGKLYTPPVECGLLKGVLIQKLLSIGFKHPSPQPSPSRGEGAEPVCEKKLYLEDLKRAEKIFCINSVRGKIEVNFSEVEL
jgi:para-aminobenzoate synthetase/4-amino-4-deoxychorismate lyase